MIICAAIKVKGYDFKAKEVDTIVCGLRHGDCLETIKIMNLVCEEKIQGFINHKGEFLNREEALKHALECGQLSATHRYYQRDHEICELYSEDLY